MNNSKFITIIIAAALALAGCGGPANASQTDGFSRSATVEYGRMEVRVSGTGRIESAAQAALSFKLDGTVGTVNVDVGDEVHQGELLMELDPASLDVNLASAEAELIQAEQQLDEVQDLNNWRADLAQARQQLAQAEQALEDAEYMHRVRQQGNRASQETIDAAEARLVLAENMVDRAKAEYDKFSGRDSDDPARALALQMLANARQERDAALRALNWYKGAPDEIEQAQLDADVAVAEANLAKARERVEILEEGPDPDAVRAAQSHVDAAQARVNQARLTAPFTSTVMAVNYAVGDSITPGQAAVRLADRSQLHVETSIDELDIASVKLGQHATITLDALPEARIEGEVAKVDLVPDPTTSTTEYPIRVNLTLLDERARVGMTVTVDILVDAKDNALIIPNWTLRFDSDSGEVYVNLQQEGQIERRSVELGLRNESFSEVLDGLDEGDLIGVQTGTDQESSGFSGPFGG
ncbi:MAG: efflux RND transporter periplasmic adaptor subunit [Anaerolineales bacterium]